MGDRDRGRGGPPEIKGMCSLKVDISGRPPTKWNVEDLKELFSKYGEVGDVFIPRAKHSDRQCGFAFVRFQSEREGSEALRKMNGYKLEGAALTVTRAQFGRGEKTGGGGGRTRSPVAARPSRRSPSRSRRSPSRKRDDRRRGLSRSRSRSRSQRARSSPSPRSKKEKSKRSKSRSNSCASSKRKGRKSVSGSKNCSRSRSRRR
mmetsp:Transcript_126411/g.404749  ORF Transcript_126411/g.404749 Transcript_126411/m.404749 type:complete len:204 (-) Transcript_126411:313-924(-)